MKAAVITELRRPPVVQELPDPTPGPGDAVIRVEACGVCRSDWHFWQGDWTWVGLEPTLPMVLGHEFGGVVESVGSGVRNFKPGDRVTVPFHLACGHCDYCYSGRSNLCGQGIYGAALYGGYASKVLIPNADANLVGLPEGVDALSAAALGCRYMTAYHGVVDRASLRPGEWVAVFGAGGVGLSAVQIASAVGARVIAVDISDEKLARAKEEGAEAVVNAAKTTVPEAIQDLTGGGAAVTVDALGSVNTAVPAVLSLVKSGRHVQIGLTGRDEKGLIPLPVDVITFKELKVIGSLGCPTSSYKGLLDLVATKRLNPQRLVSRTIALEEVGDTLAAMSEFNTVGFTVITQF